MATSVSYDTRAIAAAFTLLGDFASAEPYGSGHINDTFALEMTQGGRRLRYVLQRINHNIFKNPDGLMENVELLPVTGRWQAQARGVLRDELQAQQRQQQQQLR